MERSEGSYLRVTTEDDDDIDDDASEQFQRYLATRSQNRRPSFQHMYNPNRRPSTVFLQSLASQQHQHELQVGDHYSDRPDSQDDSSLGATPVAHNKQSEAAKENATQQQSSIVKRAEQRKKPKETANTEVLRARAEEYQLNGEIKQFRIKHQNRLKSIEGQKETLEQHRHQLKQRIDDNGKFIAEQFNKQLRAEARYREEHRAVKQLGQELFDLEEQADQLAIRLFLVSKEIEKGESYRQLLLLSAKISSNTVGSQMSEADIMNLIQKHQTLKLERVQKLTDELNSGHEIDRLNTMLQLDTLQSKHDCLRNRNQSHEQSLFYTSEKHRQELLNKGKILQAIDNLLSKCRSKHFKSIRVTDEEELANYPEMLEHIQEFVLYEYDVIYKSKQLIEQYSEQSSRKKSKRRSQITTITNTTRSHSEEPD
ncbi:uncharacterized protein LOC142351552 isoform X2 [Convolutriloba macropyga]|uniref:uncharacterized protein LOC142351552 isoform X2 n=1 Tax=Convolutriloba macropyga TaxID=536237 RepID=UPI003F525CC5